MRPAIGVPGALEAHFWISRLDGRRVELEYRGREQTLVRFLGVTGPGAYGRSLRQFRNAIFDELFEPVRDGQGE